MINIAICDDDVAITSSIEKKLDKISKELVIDINCAVFFDGFTLVENIRQGTYYDLIYLDIEMRKIDGITAAELIRNMEIPALIVYISNHEKYLKELFNTEPFRFISKPINEIEFRSVFFDAHKRICQNLKYFSYTYNKKIIKVPLGIINYFESKNRIIHIYTTKKIITPSLVYDESECKFYGKLNDVEKQLADSNVHFIRIHQSYLVNFDYIKSMNFTTVTMSNGVMLQISNDKQKKVRNQFCTIAGKEVFYNDRI